MGDASYIGTNMMFYLWMFSVFFNSFYSFWWDVTHDWGLEMLKWKTWANTPSLMKHGISRIHRRTESSPNPNAKANRAPSSRSSPSAEGGHFAAHSSTLQANGSNGSAHGRHQSTAAALAEEAGLSDVGGVDLRKEHRRTESKFLRAKEYEMLFPPIAYQCAVICDLILRFTWSLKLSSHLHHLIELESTAFYLEALEILRRWAWTYLRVEWEACKRKEWEDESSMESLTLASLRVRAENSNQQRESRYD
jgi:hypothetical protein